VIGNPVSLKVASRMPRVGLGTTRAVVTFAKRKLHHSPQDL
jgi:hypothetical protein